MITEKRITVTEEKRICTGLIVSTEFNRLIKPVLQLDYFTNSYLKTIATWCVVFFEEHKTAPFKHIKDIYESEAHKLHESDSELIGELLGILSDQYDPEAINVDYLKDCALDYFRKRELEIIANNITILKEKGEYAKAEQELEEFSKVSLINPTRTIINLGDIDQITEIYKKREEKDKKFFRLPGDLGKYLGNHKRGDVVGYHAPQKRGKTWALTDNFKHGILSKRKTVFWSIEMTVPEVTTRAMKSFEPMVNEEGLHSFPVFDCIKNQTGECRNRKSKVIVLDGPEFINDPAHQVCTKCMRHPKYKHNFKVTIYQDSIHRKQDDIFTVREKISSMEKIFDKYGRIIVHPKYTLTYEKMKQDIDDLYITSGFIPDIFIIDYIDIMGIDSRFDGYKEVDEKWKLLARIAGEYNVLVITATQANKEGLKAGVLDATHQGGFYGISM